MTFSYNLVDQPWIPCIHPDGKVRDLSLKETLIRSDHLLGIRGDSPLETAALYRLLLAVLHSALRGPRSYEDWAALWEARQWNSQVIGAYLDRWYDRFDLFHPETPFYQAADDRVKPKSVVTLVIDMVSGNNAVLFDHHTELSGADLLPGKAARTLVTAQTFSLAGLSGLEQKFTDAPWARGIIFLTEGDMLFETLCLNMLRIDYPSLGFGGSIGQPAWELENPYEPAREVPSGYLDYLTWQSRRILLIPEGDPKQPVVRRMTLAPGLRLSADILDPLKHYRIDKDRGYLVLRYSADRALWRDSAALLRLQGAGSARPPAAFLWLSELISMGILKEEQIYRIGAYGMANNQAKVEFFRQDHIPLALHYLENQGLVEQLGDCLTKAEIAGRSLWTSTTWMAVLCISPGSDGKQWKEVNKVTQEEANDLCKYWAPERFYWSGLELPFLRLLEDLPGQPEAAQAWQKAVQTAAWQSFNRTETQAGEDPKALKAAVRARESLAYALNQLHQDTELEKTL